MCACVPPPAHRIARLTPKMHAKNADWGPRTRPNLPHASPPPLHLNSKNGQKYFGGPLVFPTHVWDSAHPLVYMTGLLTKNWNNIGFGFFFHEDICIADLLCAMTRPEML